MTMRATCVAAALAAAGVASAASANGLEAQIAAGAAVFAEECAVCHGDGGEGGSGYPNAIIGGQGLLKFRTAKRLFDYNAAMTPYDDPGRVALEAKWDVTAYQMHRNGWPEGVEEPVSLDNARALRLGE